MALAVKTMKFPVSEYPIDIFIMWLQQAFDFVLYVWVSVNIFIFIMPIGFLYICVRVVIVSGLWSFIFGCNVLAVSWCWGLMGVNVV